MRGGRKGKTFSIFYVERHTHKYTGSVVGPNLLGVEIGPEIFCSAFALLLTFPKSFFFIHFLLLIFFCRWHLFQLSFLLEYVSPLSLFRLNLLLCDM